EVWLEHCQFNASTNFNGGSFAGTISFEKSAFKEDASFNSMKVGRAAFRHAVFERSVDFTSADITSSFEAQWAKVQNKEKGASFNTMKVRGYAVFNDAVFEGPADFTLADITRNFEANGAKFQNKQKDASFSAIKVGGYAFFNDAVFEGPMDFIKADIASNFEANGAKFQNMEKEASFNGMKVGGYAFFNDAVFEGPVNFGYSDFAWLDLSSASSPKVAAQLYMQGMSYKYIRAAPEEPESHTELLKLAKQSAYTADVYSNLEAFFLRQGYRADADKAFIAGKVRERKEYFRSDDWFGWLRSWMLCFLVG